MKLLVIGSTGRTGRHVVEQGIKRGHAITAFARSPQKLSGVQGLQGIIQGDGLIWPTYKKRCRVRTR